MRIFGQSIFRSRWKKYWSFYNTHTHARTHAHTHKHAHTHTHTLQFCPPPPPMAKVQLLKCLKNALSYRLATFWQFKLCNFQNKNLIFNRLDPPLVTIATPKVDPSFWRAYFGSFHAKAPTELEVFFAIYMKSVHHGIWCETLGLVFPFNGVLVTILVPRSLFWCFNENGQYCHRDTNNGTNWFFFYKLSENFTFLGFHRGEQNLNGDSQSALWKLWAALKRWSWFSWKPKLFRTLIFGQAFTKFSLNGFWEG